MRSLIRCAKLLPATAGALSLPLTDGFGEFKLVVVFSLFGSDPAKQLHYGDEPLNIVCGVVADKGTKPSFSSCGAKGLRWLIGWAAPIFFAHLTVS